EIFVGAERGGPAAPTGETAATGRGAVPKTACHWTERWPHPPTGRIVRWGQSCQMISGRQGYSAVTRRFAGSATEARELLLERLRHEGHHGGAGGHAVQTSARGAETAESASQVAPTPPRRFPPSCDSSFAPTPDTR